MSSVESMIVEIEENYHNALKELDAKKYPQSSTTKFSEVSEEYIVNRIRDTMKLQRTIESSMESLKSIAKHTKFEKRVAEVGNSLVDLLCSGDVTDRVRFSAFAYESGIHKELEVRGVIPLLKHAHKRHLHGDIANSRRYCYIAYFALKSAISRLIELEEEMRLIGVLTTYPISKKARLKNLLIMDDFNEVAVSLEEAESNVETEHFKDCVSRCRDSIEILISSISERETGEKSRRHFSSDLGSLVKIELFEEATRKLAQGVYSFLSLKGSHKYDAKKVTIYDAETSLKETYSLLEMLLKRYSDVKKARKSD